MTDAADLRLRPERPRVVRLSRAALAALGAVAGAGLGGLLIYALRPSVPEPARELHAPEGRPGAEALADAPRDYSEVPRLGPPLPGDLGRAILDARAEGRDVPAPLIRPAPSASSRPDPIEQEGEAARTSTLFLASATARRGAPASPPSSLAVEADSAVERPRSPRGAFLVGDGTGGIVSPERLAPPASPAILQAGAVIPAALITGIRSDLPGPITAQVTAPVYDSPTGRILLIPQGARLIGAYDAQVSFGQQRVLLTWDRLIFPDGRSMALAGEPGADPAGQAGLQDRVDHHWGGVARAALVSSLLGVGAELAADDEDDVARAIRRGTQDTINEAGQRIVERQLGVAPTLTIRPGHPVRVMVTRDLVFLEPWGAER